MTTREKVGIASICLAAMLLPFSVTGPGVSLGEISQEIGAGPSVAQWILNTYNICFAALMFGAGVVAARIGRRRGLVCGQIGFVWGSLISAVAPDVMTILIGRGIQGIAAALILTSASQYIAIALSGSVQRIAFGLLGSSFGAGLAVGPVLCGALTDITGWRSVFVLCAVVAAVTALGAMRLRPDAATSAIHGDPAGIITFTVALASLCGYFMFAADHGFVSTSSLALLAVFLIATAAFTLVEKKASHPVIDVNLLRSKTFLCVVLQPFTILTTFAALLVYLPAYFQSHEAMSVTQSGLALLPLTIPVFVLPLVIARFSTVLGRRIILGLSPLIMGVGLILTAIAVHTGFAWVELGILVTGSGIGIAFGVMDSAAANVVPVEKVEIATGMFNSARLVSETIGIAIVGSVLLAALRSLYDEGTAAGLVAGLLPADGVELNGLVSAWSWILIALGVLGLFASWLLFWGIDDDAFDQNTDNKEAAPDKEQESAS